MRTIAGRSGSFWLAEQSTVAEVRCALTSHPRNPHCSRRAVQKGNAQLTSGASQSAPRNRFWAAQCLPTECDVSLSLMQTITKPLLESRRVNLHINLAFLN